MRKTAFLLLMVCLPATLRALDSQATGLWSDPSTWVGGVVPTASNPVNILHTVTVDDPSATAQSLNVKSTGHLTFSTSTNSTLEIVAGDLTVENGGELTMGSESNYVDKDFTATLILAKPAGLTVRRLLIQDGGVFITHGAPKSPFALAKGSVSGNNVVVPSAGAAGWKIGDRLVLGKTQKSSDDEAEVVILDNLTDDGTDATLTWSETLNFPHTADVPLVIGNLTRNVVIRSSGTAATGGGADTAYIRTETMAAEGFKARNALFLNLGNSNGEEGISVQDSRVVDISSCAFSGGNSPVGAPAYSVGSVIQRSVFHGWSGTAVSIGFISNRALRLEESAFLGGATPVSIQDTDLDGDVVIRNNYFIGTAQSSINTNSGTGYVLISSNTVVGCLTDGLSLSGRGTVVSGNRVIRSMGHGIHQNSDEAWVFANEIRENNNLSGGRAIFAPSFNAIYGANRLYDNVGGIELLFGAVNNLSIEDWIGYTPAGVGADNSSGSCGGVCITNGSTGSMLFRSARMYPTNGVNRAGLNRTGNYFASFKHDQTPGDVRIWGDYTLSSGALQLDNAVQLYVSSASAPRNMTGASSILLVNQTFDATALSQLITVIYEADNQWHVRGTSSTADVLMGPTGGTVNFPDDTNPQVNLTLTTTGREVGDAHAFLLMAASGDAGQPKTLKIGVAASGGRSRVSVGPSAALTLRGTAGGTPVIVSREEVTDGPYTLISSGTFTLENSSFSYLDSDGLQLSGTAGVSLATVTFSNGVSGGTYITARDLTSSATFYGMLFNAGPANNVRVTGADSGLAWHFSGWSGALGGQAYESDPNRKIRWIDSTAPAASALTAAADNSAFGKIGLSWNAAGNDGSSLALAPGSFRIFYSSVSADRDAAVASQAQVIISTVASPGASQSVAAENLLLGVPYYFRLWTLDESLNFSVPGDAQSSAGQPSFSAPAAFPTPAADSITVAWSPPSDLPAAYRGRYELRVSTGNAIGPYSPVNLNISAVDTFYVHGGLAPETAYYYRLTAVDTGGASSPYTQVTATTPDQSPPSKVTPLVAGTGANPGEVVLNFNAPADNLGLKDLPAGSRYLVQHAASAGVSWNTASAQISVTTGPVVAGTPQTLVLTGLPTGLRYFTLWTLDNGGNVSAPSDVVFASAREYAPSASLAPFGPAAAPASARTRTVGVVFSKAMDTALTEGAFSLVRVKDRLGADVSDAVAGTFAWDGVDQVLTFTPGQVLEGNSVYEARVAASAEDTQGNALAAPFASRFRTLMDPSQENLWEDESGVARVLIPAGALSDESGLVTASGEGALAQAAAQKMVSNAGDELRRPIPGTVIDLTVADGMGAPGAQTFARQVTVSLPYPDADGDGRVDATSPPVKVKTLSVYWLDEARGLWVRLPSTVDTSLKRVSAPAAHFTTFALIGQSDDDVAEAYAFPVPYRGTGDILFNNVPQKGKIRIFTIAGELVREIPLSDGVSQPAWDVKTSDGEPAAPGVYFYEVTSGDKGKTGRLVVIR